MGPLQPVVDFAKEAWTSHRKGLVIFAGIVVVLAVISLAFGTN